MDTTKGCGPIAPPLLVRWADPAGQQHVVTLLHDIPLSPREVADLVRLRGVLVLSDVTLPLSAPPLAAAAFRLDRAAGAAELAGIGVAALMRRQGLGRRLLTGALTLLRAEGFERVQAWAGPGAGTSLLASAGFTIAGGAAQSCGGSRFVLLL